MRKGTRGVHLERLHNCKLVLASVLSDVEPRQRVAHSGKRREYRKACLASRTLGRAQNR